MNKKYEHLTDQQLSDDIDSMLAYLSRRACEQGRHDIAHLCTHR